jgi:hypothetical protein
MNMNIEDTIYCLFRPNDNVRLISDLQDELDDKISQVSYETFGSVHSLYKNVSVVFLDIGVNTLFWTLNEYEY